MQRLLAAPCVRILRIVSSQVGGRMLTEAEAPDQQTLEKSFKARYVYCEWIVRIELDAQTQRITEY